MYAMSEWFIEKRRDKSALNGTPVSSRWGKGKGMRDETKRREDDKKIEREKWQCTVRHIEVAVHICANLHYKCAAKMYIQAVLPT